MAVQGLNSYQDFDKWKLGLNQTQQPPVDQKTPIDKQPPVEPSYEIKDPFGLNAYRGVTGVEGTPGAYGVGRATPTDGWVSGIDGTRISCTNSQGYVGCTEHASSPNGLNEKPGFVPRTLSYA